MTDEAQNKDGVFNVLGGYPDLTKPPPPFTAPFPPGYAAYSSSHAPHFPSQPLNVTFSFPELEKLSLEEKVPTHHCMSFPISAQQSCSSTSVIHSTHTLSPSPLPRGRPIKACISAVEDARQRTNEYISGIIDHAGPHGKKRHQNGNANGTLISRKSRVSRGSLVESSSCTSAPLYHTALRPPPMMQNNTRAEGDDCCHGFPYSCLECQYSASHWTKAVQRDGLHPNQVMGNYVRKMGEASKRVAEEVKGELDVSYDDSSPGAKMDLFGANLLPPGSPILAFIHGGYWQEGSRQLSRTMVAPLVGEGVIVAVVGYDLAIKKDVSLTVISEQIATALRFLNNFAKTYGESELFVSGHSAGAHLALMGLLLNGEHLNRLRGLFLLSGVYDLRPIKDTYINKALNLTDEEVERLSPLCRVGELGGKLGGVQVEVVSGEFDSPVFQNNAMKMWEELEKQHLLPPPTLHILPDHDHFSMIECLDDPTSKPASDLIQWIKH